MDTFIHADFLHGYIYTWVFIYMGTFLHGYIFTWVYTLQASALFLFLFTVVESEVDGGAGGVTIAVVFTGVVFRELICNTAFRVVVCSRFFPHANICTFGVVQ